jgi:hypothetical protein
MHVRKVTVAIIGTAGRSPDQLRRLSAASLVWMQEKALRQLSAWKLDPKEVTLVSGASAWSDHAAVLLYLNHGVPGLRLFAPCDFDKVFVGGPAAAALNQYHGQYREKTGQDSIAEIAEAVSRGAELRTDARGFHARNSEVARSDYLMAFTFSNGPRPGTSGTLDTWNKCRGTKIHWTIPSL